MPKDIDEAVRDVCLWLPGTEEFLSHGSPNFRVHGGKVYAVYAVNLHATAGSRSGSRRPMARSSSSCARRRSTSSCRRTSARAAGSA